jgi:hypothetical protein
MSRIVIVILMYHRYKPIDPVYHCLFLLGSETLSLVLWEGEIEGELNSDKNIWT